MAEVIVFYEHWRPTPHIQRPEPAVIIILPVVRIERYDEPSPYGLAPKAERQRLRRKALRAGPNIRN